MTYKVQRTLRSKPFSVHVDLMKPYKGEQPPSEWMDAPDVTADDSALSVETLPPVTEADDSSEHSIISYDDRADMPTDDASYQSPQHEMLRRSCPYSRTL